MIGRHFSACNDIYNHISMKQYDLALEKYWATQSIYFRFTATVALGMGIIYAGLLFCHGISEKSKENAISMRECNDRTFYDWFNNLFSIDCGSPYLNFPHIPVDDSPRPNRMSWYTSDPLPAAISVTPGYYVSTLTTPSDSPQLLEPNYDDSENLHTIMNDNIFRGRMTRGYCSRFYYVIKFYKDLVSIAPHHIW